MGVAVPVGATGLPSTPPPAHSTATTGAPAAKPAPAEAEPAPQQKKRGFWSRIFGGGRDNRVEYNIIVGGVAGVQVDSRGLTWARDRVDGDDALLPRLLASVCTEGSACQARYPELARLLQDEPAVAKGNRLAHNLILCPIAIDLQGRPTHRGVVVAGNLATGQSQLGHHPDQNLLSLWQRLAGTAP